MAATIGRVGAAICKDMQRYGWVSVNFKLPVFASKVAMVVVLKGNLALHFLLFNFGHTFRVRDTAAILGVSGYV